MQRSSSRSVETPVVDLAPEKLSTTRETAIVHREISQDRLEAAYKRKMAAKKKAAAKKRAQQQQQHAQASGSEDVAMDAVNGHE